MPRFSTAVFAARDLLIQELRNIKALDDGDVLVGVEPLDLTDAPALVFFGALGGLFFLLPSVEPQVQDFVQGGTRGVDPLDELLHRIGGGSPLNQPHGRLGVGEVGAEINLFVRSRATLEVVDEVSLATLVKAVQPHTPCLLARSAHDPF